MTASYRGPERRWTPRFLSVGPVEIPYVDRAKAIQTIDRSFHDRQQIKVAFCNANTMLRALKSQPYAEALSRFLVLNDGVGIDICSVLFAGRPFEDNLNGTDFLPELLVRATRDLRIFLLGGAPGTAETAARRLAEDHPRHAVVGAHHGFFDDTEADAVIAQINAVAPDLVLVAMGNPRQEAFIAAAYRRLDAPVLIGIGAFLDFTAGNVVRAPAALRAVRAEWLFRLAQEPRRLARRYTVDVAGFLLIVARLRLAAALSRRRAAAAATAGRRLRPAE